MAYGGHLLLVCDNEMMSSASYVTILTLLLLLQRVIH